MTFWLRFLTTVVGAALLTASASAAELAVVGTGDGVELLQAVGSAFNAQQSDTKIVVPPSIGSGGAVAAVGAERNQLGRVARPLTDAEKAQGLQEAPLVRIPSAIFAHPDVGVRGITSQQLAGIFSGRVENWKDVGGADLKVRVVRREETDSTLTVLRSSMSGWKDLTLTNKSKVATTTQEAVEAVKRVPGAVGFGPYSRAIENGAIVLAIDGKGPHAGDYPSAVTLSLIFKRDKLDDGARSFLSFAKSDAARKALATHGGIPLTQ
ncbi:PstS family phosphate ABC transporter substrate-binding protein [uncultured Enterovirga sp.]|uniref:PstS family phosphate ABC transporter substrate-binding protein n=1 Tax=uncultured Enterovirga sp. TaxID=2026352 RepID=UPI0035CB2AD7